VYMHQMVRVVQHEPFVAYICILLPPDDGQLVSPKLVEV
jgi:hypothetical protein